MSYTLFGDLISVDLQEKIDVGLGPRGQHLAALVNQG